MMLTYTDVAGLAHQISARGEMMNLTDMWKAAGKPSGRAPADWREVTTTIEFVEHFALTAGGAGNLFVTRQGRSGGTFAHWQIGLAYAKYLSPGFHMGCNTVAREKMRAMAADASRVAPQASIVAI